jgi:hypothetical protein
MTEELEWIWKEAVGVASVQRHCHDIILKELK